MSKKRKKINEALDQFLIYIVVVFLLLLTSANLQNYLSSKEVLGVSVDEITQDNQSVQDRMFWHEFLLKNPNYIPGWIELGRMDKVREIDPNYLILKDN